jgi:hypothetical protein
MWWSIPDKLPHSLDATLRHLTTFNWQGVMTGNGKSLFFLVLVVLAEIVFFGRSTFLTSLFVLQSFFPVAKEAIE